MNTTPRTSIAQTVHCPNCGSLAQRHYGIERSVAHPNCAVIVQTECPVCDYLMVSCDPSGSVIEAYAPGISIFSREEPAATAVTHRSRSQDSGSLTGALR